MTKSGSLEAADDPEGRWPPRRRQLSAWYRILAKSRLRLQQNTARRWAQRSILDDRHRDDLAHGEVAACSVQREEIPGALAPKGGMGEATASDRGESQPSPLRLRSIRAQGPKLV